MLLDNILFFFMSQKNQMNVELHITAIFLDSCGASTVEGGATGECGRGELGDWENRVISDQYGVAGHWTSDVKLRRHLAD